MNYAWNYGKMEVYGNRAVYPLGLLWQPKFLEGSLQIPRANLLRAKIGCSLEAHQPGVCSLFPFLFHAEIIHERGGREGFLCAHESHAAFFRSRRRPVATPPPLAQVL